MNVCKSVDFKYLLLSTEDFRITLTEGYLDIYISV